MMMIASERALSVPEAWRGSESQVRDTDKILASVMAGVAAPGHGRVGGMEG